MRQEKMMGKGRRRRGFFRLSLLVLLLLQAFRVSADPGPVGSNGIGRESEKGPGVMAAPPAAEAEVKKSQGIYDASGFVVLSEWIPEAIYEIRNYTGYNFVGRRIAGFEEPCALMTREAASALQAVSEELLQQGYKLKIHDAYRPQSAVNDYLAWAEDPEDRKMQEVFYPDVDKSQLFALGYLSAKSGHSRGSTVDLTLYDIAKGEEVDMGGPMDFMGEVSHFDYAGITEEQRANRVLLRESMERHGFLPISTEWWHFRLDQEPYPDFYFDFPVRAGVVKGS